MQYKSTFKLTFLNCSASLLPKQLQGGLTLCCCTIVTSHSRCHQVGLSTFGFCQDPLLNPLDTLKFGQE